MNGLLRKLLYYRFSSWKRLELSQMTIYHDTLNTAVYKCSLVVYEIACPNLRHLHRFFSKKGKESKLKSQMINLNVFMKKLLRNQNAVLSFQVTLCSFFSREIWWRTKMMSELGKIEDATCLVAGSCRFLLNRKCFCHVSLFKMSWWRSWRHRQIFTDFLFFKSFWKESINNALSDCWNTF